MKIKPGYPASRIEGSGKRSLRRPKLSTRKFSAWKKKKVVFTEVAAGWCLG
jgi:hypothetical protein